MKFLSQKCHRPRWLWPFDPKSALISLRILNWTQLEMRTSSIIKLIQSNQKGTPTQKCKSPLFPAARKHWIIDLLDNFNHHLLLYCVWIFGKVSNSLWPPPPPPHPSNNEMTTWCDSEILFLAALAALYLTLVSHWVTATLEFRHKEWLLRLETLQTFDQSDV